MPDVVKKRCRKTHWCSKNEVYCVTWVNAPATPMVLIGLMPDTLNDSIFPEVDTATAVAPPGAMATLKTDGSLNDCPVSLSTPDPLIVRCRTTPLRSPTITEPFGATAMALALDPIENEFICVCDAMFTTAMVFAP